MSTAPAFEFDGDGYPTNESLEAWEVLAPTAVGPQDAARFIVDMPSLKRGLACAQITVTDTTDKITDEPIKVVKYVTGGWSGAEDIIETVLRQFWIRHFHSKWERGGAFWFEVPVHFLK